MTGGNKSFGHYRGVKQIRQQRAVSAHGRTKLEFLLNKKRAQQKKKKGNEGKEISAVTCGVAGWREKVCSGDVR